MIQDGQAGFELKTFRSEFCGGVTYRVKATYVVAVAGRGLGDSSGRPRGRLRRRLQGRLRRGPG